MKLAVFLLLSTAALAWADSSYTHYQNQETNYPNYYQESAPSNPNYYQYGAAPAQRRRGFFESIRSLFYPNRRQGPAGLAGAAGPALAVAAGVAVVVVVVVGVAVAASSLSSSGRGLDTDEWEVDHSVWMNQLQKDFEDSWSNE